MRQTVLTKGKFSIKIIEKENYADDVVGQKKKVVQSSSLKAPPKEQQIIISDDDDNASVTFLSPNASQKKKRPTSPRLYEHKPKNMKIELSPSNKSMADSGNEFTVD